MTTKITLSAQAGATVARQIAREVTDSKGGSGRFYVNEFSHMFAPITQTLPLRYVYVGTLDLDGGWFSKSI